MIDLINMASYKPTIGLEIHAELNTKTKMFCACPNDPLEKEANKNICPICMGHPGTLPVANREAIVKLIRVGLALNCTIESRTYFERKNYFYPDLTKGYQISQFQTPFCRNGYLEIGSHHKKIRIERIHLEEDAGKLIHDYDPDWSLADYNRAGVPLMELVTRPDLDSPEDVRLFAQELQLILRYVNTSDADMEKGQMRVEVNISLAPEGEEKLGTKVEVKNINSISAASRAAMYEIERQTIALEAGETIVQETRGWDDVHQKTTHQRIKEGSADYRYFPEPDLPPVVISDDELESIRVSVPELPEQRRKRFHEEYGPPVSDVEIFVVSRELGDFYEEVVSELKRENNPESGEAKDYSKLSKVAANWLIAHRPENTKITPALFADFVVRVSGGQITSAAAQIVLEIMGKTGEDPEDIIREKDLGQVSDSASLNVIVEDVIAQLPKVAQDFKDGKEAAMKALVGKVMALSKGKANPQIAEQILREKLNN